MTRLLAASGSLLPTLALLRRQPRDECITLDDGSCVSKNCMHTRTPEENRSRGYPAFVQTRCLYPARPDVVKPERGSSRAMDKGTARHRVIEDAIRGVETHPDTWETAQLDPFGGYGLNVLGWLRARAPVHGAPVLVGVDPGLYVERALAYDLMMDGARLLPEEIGGAPRKHRDYSDVEPWELPLTLDIGWSAFERARAICCDWKCGYSQAEEAEANMQIAVQCLSLARAIGARDAIGYIAQVDDSGCVTASERYYSPEDLATIARWLVDLPAAVAAAEPIPGEHCSSKFCDLRGICPATVEAAALVIRTDPTPRNDGEALHSWSPIVQSQAHAQKILRALSFVEGWAKAAQESLEAFSRKEPIQGEDGRIWGPVPGVSESLAYDQATRAVLEDRLGDQWLYAVDTFATKSRIEKAARLHLEATRTGLDAGELTEAAKKLAAETFAALRAVGKLTEKPTESFKWHAAPALPEGAEAPKKKRGRPRKSLGTEVRGTERNGTRWNGGERIALARRG